MCVYVDASSPEEFVSYVMSRETCIDTINHVVAVDGAEAGCKQKPQLPFTALRMGRVTHYYAASVLGAGVYCIRPIRRWGKTGGMWAVAATCRRKQPIWGWERVPAELLASVLMQYAARNFWRFWPRGIELKPELTHVVVAGASASGKTTLIKRLIRDVNYIVIDFTEKGEYEDLGGVCPASISLSDFSVDDVVALYSVAIAAAVGEEGGVTGVQYGVLRSLASKLSQPEKLIRGLLESRDIPPMTQQVLVSKFMSLCVSYSSGRCVPHPAVTTPTPQGCRVYRVSVKDNFLRALITHGIVLRLLHQGAREPTWLVIDEYHKVSPRAAGVEDPVEQQIRRGRHKNIHVILSTQNPADIKRELLDIIPSHIYFALYGDAAKYAASVLNVPVDVVESLKPGEFLAKTRVGRRRW